MKATEKQVSYALYLAKELGLSTAYMNSTWKPYTTMRERQGTVEDFLINLSKARISEIISTLKGRKGA